MAKRCLIITYYFPPTGGGGVQRIVKLIKYLSRQGWQFSVITSGEHEMYLPEDKNFLMEIPENVSIHKVKQPQKKVIRSLLLRFKSSFPVRWISSLVYIPDRYMSWIKIAKKQLLDLVKKEAFDIILISSPPYSMAVLAADLTEIQMIPVVLDMRDPWTTNPYKIYPSKWHLKKDRCLEINTIGKIKHGVSVYLSLIEYYNNNFPDFKQQDWRCISNGFDEEDFVSLKLVKQDNKKLNIAFSGTFYSHLNNPEPLFKAMAELETDLRERICFHHIGSSNISLMNIAKRFNLSSNIVEWGYYSHQECLNILAGMDAFCFILDSTNPKAINTIGGKVYEYIGLGRPILALVPENGEAAKLIQDSHTGVVIDPKKTDVITGTLRSWINDLPTLKTSSDLAEYKRSNLAQKYSEFFNKIIDRQQN